AGRTWAVGENFSLVGCAAAPALLYADWSAFSPDRSRIVTASWDTTRAPRRSRSCAAMTATCCPPPSAPTGRCHAAGRAGLLWLTGTSATLADFSRARDSQITFSVTHGWSAFWRGRPWFAERRIGETSLAVGSSRFWIGWVTRHGDKCARSTCRD